ncbi:MAG: endoglucanase [Candidatus Peribacteria bacterium]|nr:endoglucanase [Candidatus Peribacteria bacterium]
MRRLTLLMVLGTFFGYSDASAQRTQAKKKVEAMTKNANPFNGARLFVDTNSLAARAARQAGGEEQKLLQKIASQPQAFWIVGGEDPSAQVREIVDAAEKEGRLVVLVAYNIPLRDFGEYSAGGANTKQGYKTWIRKFADAIGKRRAVVTLEPDALTQLERLPEQKQRDRMEMLNYAITTLKTNPSTAVYADAGHSGWKSVQEIAPRLRAAGVAKADGFSLNVSNFRATNELLAYGKRLSAAVGNKPFVLDVGRNGNGPAANGEWCNPPGRALGTPPTAKTGEPLCHAFLWIKPPGESDGNRDGAPRAGEWYQKYALELARNAKW